MSLARAWTRQLAGASLGALLAPGGLLVVMAVLVLGGGLGSVSALGQLLSGPAATPAATASASLRGASAPPAAAALLAASTPAAGGGPGTAPVTPGRLPTGPTGPGRPGRPPGGPGDGGPGRGGPRRGGPAGTTVTPVGQSGSAPAPTVADGVAGLAGSLTAPLPDPVGSAARGAIGTVTRALDSVLPPQARVRAGAAGPVPGPPAGALPALPAR